jgi:poly(3-hydroxybutyrate) depolymerase
MSSVLSGCLFTKLGPVQGPAPLRYRDVIFNDVSVTPDLQYGSAPDLNNQPVALKLDLYQPVGDTVAQRPAVVEVHGGSFTGGDKSSEAPILDPLVQRGYVGVAINYRLLGCSGPDLITACTPAAIAGTNDAQAAVRWLRANATTYRIDPNRIAVEGVSAGAVIATAVAASTDDQVGNSGNPGYSSKVQAFVSISGGLPGGMLIGPGDPAGMLFSGTLDTTAPYQWSVDTANALSATGQIAVLYSLPGLGHYIPDMTVVYGQSVSFYYLVLDLPDAQH